MKQCIIGGVLKRYYSNRDDILQKRQDKYACFKDLDNRLKALEEKVIINNSETKPPEKRITSQTKTDF